MTKIALVLDCADPAALASWLLMADPEGHRFCVCDGGAHAPERR